MLRYAVLLAVLALLAGCRAGNEDDGQERPGATGPTTGALDADPTAFCNRLEELAGSDPFAMIFGNENPMEAAAAFDNGQHQLDELAAVAPDSIAPSAERYREAFAGFRLLVLPPDTLDQASYQRSFDALRAEQRQARDDLDRHLAEECSR